MINSSPKTNSYRPEIGPVLKATAIPHDQIHILKKSLENISKKAVIFYTIQSQITQSGNWSTFTRDVNSHEFLHNEENNLDHFFKEHDKLLSNVTFNTKYPLFSEKYLALKEAHEKFVCSQINLKSALKIAETSMKDSASMYLHSATENSKLSNFNLANKIIDLSSIFEKEEAAPLFSTPPKSEIPAPSPNLYTATEKLMRAGAMFHSVNKEIKFSSKNPWHIFTLNEFKNNLATALKDFKELNKTFPLESKEASEQFKKINELFFINYENSLVEFAKSNAAVNENDSYGNSMWYINAENKCLCSLEKAVNSVIDLFKTFKSPS